MIDIARSLTLILGGIRSGKTAYSLAYGQALGVESGAFPVYIATAFYDRRDPLMQERIDTHRKERENQWHTIEAPLDLTTPIRELYGTVVVDCLSLWVNNLLQQSEKQDFNAIFSAFDESLAQSKAHIILVGIENGFGGISGNPLQRRFCDLTGLLHQTLALKAQNVIVIMAGLPLILKSNGVASCLPR